MFFNEKISKNSLKISFDKHLNSLLFLLILVPTITLGVGDESKAKSLGWFVGDRLLHPNCFVAEWMSSDNFEEYEEVFSIKGESLRESPGLFFGKEITNYQPIKPSWNRGDFISHETISLIRSVNSCAFEHFEDSVFQDDRIYIADKKEFGQLEQTYKLINPVSVSKCSRLAPSIGATCLKAFQVEVGEYSGGSFGPNIRRGIYGLFDLPELGLSIVPLRLSIAPLRYGISLQSSRALAAFIFMGLIFLVLYGFLRRKQ
jgi:hypothetical protein